MDEVRRGAYEFIATLSRGGVGEEERELSQLRRLLLRATAVVGVWWGGVREDCGRR